LASIKIENYSNIDELLVTPRLVYPLSADTKGKRVLIIDDVADRGDSLILARKHVVELGAREVRVATLHYKPWSKIKPDYYALEYRSWIVYPWEITETVRKLVLRLLEERKSMDEIKKRLLKLKITDTEINKYVRELGQN
jgi:hypoxanthine phosphoribosyltransferase